MRRSNNHGPGDLAATVIVLAVAGLVFWLAPPSVHAISLLSTLARGGYETA
jgi:hypothetical protein